MATRVLVVKSQLNPATAFMTLRALEVCSAQSLLASVRAEGEVGVQRDTLDFRGSVQRGHRVANSHLKVESGLVGVLRRTVSRWISGEQWPIAFHLPTSPKTSRVGLPSPWPPRCWKQKPATLSHRHRTSCLGR